MNLCLIDLAARTAGPLADLETLTQSHTVLDLLKADTRIAASLVSERLHWPTADCEDLRGSKVDGDVDAGEWLLLFVAIHDKLMFFGASCVQAYLERLCEACGDMRN